MERGESVCDQDSGMGAETVVIENKMLQGNVGGEECDEGGLGVESERIVVKIDGM